MIYVAYSPKSRHFEPFSGHFAPSGPQISAEGGVGYPPLGTPETWVVSTVPWPLSSRLPLHDARPAGSGRARLLPRWLLPDTDSRIAKKP